jgi:hypothetical protein
VRDKDEPIALRIELKSAPRRRCAEPVADREQQRSTQQLVARVLECVVRAPQRVRGRRQRESAALCAERVAERTGAQLAERGELALQLTSQRR